MENISCIIVDDEQEACDRLESLLEKIDNVKILSKETKADDGIEAAVELFPDIIFLDIEMPGKSGFDIVKSIREKNVFPTFIFVTGYSQYAINAIRSSAFDFLLKPVDLDELKDAIKRFFTSQNDKLKNKLPEKLKNKFSLSEREIEIVQYLLEGRSSKEIANTLFISKNTVDTHRRNILEKMKLKNTKEIVSYLSGYKS